MNKEALVKLTNNLYRMTLFFPKKEPLRYKMRETAASFLANPNKDDLEVMDKFFEIALVQNWVSPNDLLAIKQEYVNLVSGFDNNGEIRQPVVLALQKEVVSMENDQKLSERQGRILDFLKENGRAQVWQIKEVLPDVTKRTLRRDFESLVNNGVLERVGERNNTFYQIANLPRASEDGDESKDSSTKITIV